MLASEKLIDVVLTRRSTRLTNMNPDKDLTDYQVSTILEAAVRVPDYGKNWPWRFIVFRGDRRQAFTNVLREAYTTLFPNEDEVLANQCIKCFERAPVVIVVASKFKPQHPKVTVFEQTLSIGAACQNMLTAAHFLGLGGQWLTGWVTKSEIVSKELGIEEYDKIAGCLYFGHMTQKTEERPRPKIADVTRRY